VGFTSPEKKLEEFLASQPVWLQKILQLNYSLSQEELIAWSECDWWWHDTQGKIEDEYQRLVQRCPIRWREYCQRRREMALSNVPSPQPGAPRKDALANEAIELRQAGWSYAKIAIELNRRYGAETTNREAIRSLIRSRDAAMPPEET
jgi:hypothetical protein